MTSGEEIIVEPRGLRFSQAAIAFLLTATAFGIGFGAIGSLWNFVLLAAGLIVTPRAAAILRRALRSAVPLLSTAWRVPCALGLG